MEFDISAERLFRQPPNRLFSLTLGKPITVRRHLPTESMVVEKVQPDMFLETEEGEILHAELHGYGFSEFACRNLIYYALALRDYGRPPLQVVYWIGRQKPAVPAGLSYPPGLEYRFTLVDVRERDGELLLEEGGIPEAVFAILCKLKDERDAVTRILRRIRKLPVGEQREAVGELLVLSGLRGLKPLVKQEVNRMPFVIDIHENEYLEEIWQEGKAEGRAEGKAEGTADGMRKSLLLLLDARFGNVPEPLAARIATADPTTLERWLAEVVHAQSLAAEGVRKSV